ncbi:cilia- and flagella-associated protein 157 [Engraulis encrasicolus]|uniref:cilia- and flagella-associated protein 157 n=1 Tax=Engraulis encrasicolus TaxID=184585 RepID=UPI002FD50433
MAPGKKDKKSGDKQSKRDTTDKSNLDEAWTVEFYRAQIRDLEERLEKYQHKCDELEIHERDFNSKYSHAEKEKRDIVLYLKRAVAQKEDELSDLSERLISLNQSKEAEKETFELQLSQLRQEFQEVKDKLTSENIVLAGKLAALEEFRTQKEDLMAQLVSHKEQLQKQREEHQAIIYNLERKAVLDNDRLKREMQQHVSAVAAEFRRVSDRKMPETTMRAIHENVAVTAQLKQLSDKSKVLLEENQALRQREKTLKQEVKVLEPLLDEMTRKSLTNEKVVHQLKDKCKQMSGELKAAGSIHEEYQQLQSRHASLQTEMDLLREMLMRHQELCVRHQAEVSGLTEELQQERTNRGHLQTILQEAATALTDILKDVPAEEDSEMMAMARRSQMLKRLLTVLDTAAAVGRGTDFSDFIRQKHVCTLDSDNARLNSASPLAKASGQLSHFKTGVLGIVPPLKLNSSVKKDHVSVATRTSKPLK